MEILNRKKVKIEKNGYHFYLKQNQSEVKVAQSCLTLCDPMDCRPPGFSVHGIFQAKYWNELPFPSPGDLPDPEIECTPLALAGRFFTTEPSGKPL